MSRFAFATLLLLLSCAAQAAPACTLVVEARSGAVLHQQGACDTRNSPASSFKLPLALMGYDAGVLTGPHAPAWTWQPAYGEDDPAKKTTIDPSTWLSASVVWYSQLLVREMGQQRFQAYVDAFGYGNRDLSGKRGTAGTKGALPQAVWVSSSLKISPREQVAMLRKLLDGSLPVSSAARASAMAVTPQFTMAEGWVAQGKTGTGFQPGANGRGNPDRQYGWFIGWASKGERTVVFARLVKDDAKHATYAGPRARDAMLAELPALLR